METTRDRERETNTQYHYDTLTRPNARPRSYFNWVPLLLIPLFFVIGWAAKGAYDVPRNDVNSPTYGVGGGPGDVTPYPAGYVVSPTPVTNTKAEEVITPSVTPTIDSEVEDTATPSPTSSARTKASSEPTATPED